MSRIRVYTDEEIKRLFQSGNVLSIKIKAKLYIKKNLNFGQSMKNYHIQKKQLDRFLRVQDLIWIYLMKELHKKGCVLG